MGVKQNITVGKTNPSLPTTPADLCLHTKVEVTPYTERDLYAEMMMKGKIPHHFKFLFLKT